MLLINNKFIRILGMQEWISFQDCPDVNLAEKFSALTVYTYLKLGMQTYLSIICYLNL